MQVPGRSPVRPFGLALLLALSVALPAGCGSSSSSSSAGAAKPAAHANLTSSPAVDELPVAEHPTADQFPAAGGRTLKQLSASATLSAAFGAATGTFTPGTKRVAFALTNSSNQFIYAPTAVYVASSASGAAQGPFLAPADPTGVPLRFRSAQNAGPGGLQAIYHAQLPLANPGVYDVLTLTRTPKGTVAATGEVAVAGSSPIPDVGQRPPAIATETLATVHGQVGLLTTRTPPEQMHAVSFRDVLGKKPIALLFSTPELCISKVCGPVTDVTVSLQPEFGNQIAFIHQEIYVDNKPNLGLRPQMKAFHLETEPWLFAINRHGVIVARLEGAFGTQEVKQALQAALKG